MKSPGPSPCSCTGETPPSEPLLCPTWGSQGPGAPTQGSQPHQLRPTRREALVGGGAGLSCLLPGSCEQIGGNLKSPPEGRRVSPRQLGILQNPRWGALLHPPEVFSAPQ